MEYVGHMYDNTSTVLKVNGRRNAPIVCGRGVRQGDPLSAILFNCVMDEVIGRLSKSIRFELQENLIDVLLSSLRLDMDGKVKRCVINPKSYLRLEGKEINSFSIAETYKYLGLQAGSEIINLVTHP